MQSPLLTRAALDSDRDGLIQLIGNTYAEYPGCVLAVEQEEQDLLGIASAYAGYGGEFWVTLDPASGGLVASVGWLPSSASERRGWLELRKLYVARTHRRHGLASALVARVESAARERGAPGVELWSDTRFLDAHRLYARHGYQRGGQRQLFDLSHSVEYHFEKRLQ
jgi:putative acetyltransferase